MRREPDGSLAVHAHLTGLPDGGWNEIVADGRGNVYINGAGFDLMAGEKFAPGILAVATADGSVRQVADGIAFPHGMTVTLFIIATEWRGPENMTSGPRTGQVLTAAAPAPGIGWP